MDQLPTDKSNISPFYSRNCIFNYFTLFSLLYYGEFGGAYVPEILHKCVEELTNKYLEVIESEEFKKECEQTSHQLDFPKNVKSYGKGSKERIIQIGNEDVLTAVNAYYSAFSQDFVNRLGHRLSDQSVCFMVNKCTNLAGIDLHITPHMFRHSFATLLLRKM